MNDSDEVWTVQFQGTKPVGDVRLSQARAVLDAHIGEGQYNCLCRNCHDAVKDVGRTLNGGKDPVCYRKEYQSLRICQLCCSARYLQISGNFIPPTFRVDPAGDSKETIATWRRFKAPKPLDGLPKPVNSNIKSQVQQNLDGTRSLDDSNVGISNHFVQGQFDPFGHGTTTSPLDFLNLEPGNSSSYFSRQSTQVCPTTFHCPAT